MKRSIWKMILVWQLVLSILFPTLPFEWAQGLLLSAKAEAQASAAARSVERSFMEMAEAAADMKAFSDGEWRYAVIQPENYAVILGHADPSAQDLTVPAVLGGADVVALAPGALGDHAALESLSLPGNVNAIGKKAIPAGTLVRGYHGTYAHTYALGNGYAFQSLSAYDFAQGVIDYADIRTDAFVRYSAYSLSLRRLEAARLHEGSVFFLVDPNNAYQISYYRVLSMQEQGDGFVSVACETPIMDEVVRSFSGQNEVMMLDPSTLVLGDGVSIARPRAGGMIDAVELPLKFTFPMDKVKVTITGSYKASFVAVDYQGKKDSKKSATIEQRESVDITISVEQKGGLSPDSVFKDQMSSIKEIAGKAQSLAKEFDYNIPVPYKHPLGMGYVFSYAGLVTLQAQFNLDFEIKGSGTLVYKSETVTTLHGDTDGNATKSTVVEHENITGSAQLKGKVGIRAEANLYLYCVCVFQVSGFVGFKAELKWEILNYDLTDGKYADYDKAINMMDCLKLEVRFVVEIGIRAGVLKVFNVDLPMEVSVGATFKLVDKKLIDKHLHLMPYVLHAELLTGDLSFGEEKEQNHNSSDCPYGKSSLEVRLSLPVEKQKELYMQFDHLDPGFTINEPEDPTLPYDDYKLTYWHNSTKAYESNRVTFPYTIQEGDNLLYGYILKKHYIHFIYEDGTEICDPLYLFAGDTFTLPETDRPTIKWLRVQSPYNLKEHRNQLTVEDGVYKAPPESVDVYLCAFEAPEIKVTFYESVDGGLMYETGTVTSKAGQTVEAPETTMSAHYEDAGWRLVDGGDITMPYTIPVMQTEPVKLVHFLGIKPSDDDYTWKSGAYPTPSSGQSDHLWYSVSGSGTDAYVTIHGRTERWKDEDGYEHYSPTYDLIIPSMIEGAPVKYIGETAFKNHPTLRTVTLPSTIVRISKSAFEGCTSLRKVDASAGTGTLTLLDYAFAGCTYLTDFTVSSSASVHYGYSSLEGSGIVQISNIASMGTFAFADCRNLQRADLLPSCTAIPGGAFQNCPQLRDIELPEGITSIGGEAFQNCSSLLEMEIPYGVNSYGNDIFKGCTSLKTIIAHGGKATLFNLNAPAVEYVEIGEGFTEIKASVYSGVRSLKTVLLPDSLQIIGDYAFRGTSVSEFDLPEGMTSVGKYAFAENPFLSSIKLDCAALGDYAFMNCPAMTSAELSGMDAIPVSAFEGCVSLEEISIPAVKSIGKRAFYNCLFEEITLYEGLESIGDEAFYHCRNLQLIATPSTLKSIGKKAFYQCESLIRPEFQYGLERIGSYAFAECTAMEEFILPDSVYEVNEYTIQNCINLKKLRISGSWLPTANSAIARFYAYAIGEINSLEYIEFGEGITEIGQQLFEDYYTSVETIVFPSTLEKIYGNSYSAAFRGCGVREVIIRGNIKSIGGYVFYNCPRLETVIIEGEGVTIGEKAFANTPALRTVYFNGVETLDESVFRESGVESIVIDEGIQKIGLYAFMDCTQLENLSIANTLTSIGGCLINCPSLKELRIGGKLSDMAFTNPGGSSGERPSLRVLEIGEGTTVIPEDLFADQVSALEVLTLPDTLVEIQRWGFKGLGIREITLPDSLEIISYAAFQDSKLEHLELPPSVRELRSSAFENSQNLKSVTIHGEDVVIGEYAFRNCTSLEEIIVRGSIKSIGLQAFANCNIKVLEFDNNVASIGSYAFENNPNLRSLILRGPGHVSNGIVDDCDNLEYLYIDGIETIRQEMFNSGGDLPGLRTLVIGEGVKVVGSNAFGAIYNGLVYKDLESVTLPSSLEEIQNGAFKGTGISELIIKGKNLKSIGQSAFAGCRNLETIQLDGTGLAIGNYAFDDCSALVNVQIGSGIQSIGQYTFSDCSSLQQVTFPEGLERVDRYAFYNCKALKSVTFPDSVTYYGDTIFRYCDKLERLHIGGGADLSQSPGKSLLSFTAGIKHVVIGEGPTTLAENAISTSSSSKLETVTFPESMTVFNKGNLSRLSRPKWVKLSSATTTIVNNGDQFTSSYRPTFVTDTYNEVVAQYAADTGASYLALDGEVPEHTVQFYLSVDGEAGSQPLSTAKAGLLSGLELPTPPAQDGYRFTGWYYDAACTLPVAADAPVTGDMSLYAGFLPVGVTLFALRLPPFMQIPGAEESALVPDGFHLYARMEQTDAMPASPACDGYVFTGWYRDSKLYLPCDPADGLPSMLYGGFVEAGRGGLAESNPTGATLTHYTLTESDTTYVTLPETLGGANVTQIGANAFKDLPVTELVIPAHVAQIDPQAFHGAAKLSQLHVDARNAYFTSVDGVLYSHDRTILVHYPQGRRATSFTVPDTVKIIAERAFENNASLRSVVLPEGLETIGAYAFARTSLQKVTLPDSVRNLGQGAFEGCAKLTSFTAYGLESIGADALSLTPTLAVRGPILQGALRSYAVGDTPLNLIYNIRYLTVMDGSKELAAYAVEAGAPLPAQAQGDTAGEGRIVYALYADASLTRPVDPSAAMPNEDLTLYADIRPLYAYAETTLESGERGLMLTAYHGNGGAIVLPQQIDGKPVIALGENLLASARGKVTSVAIGSSVVHIADTALCGAGGEAYAGSILADAGSCAAQWAAQMGYACEGSVYTLSFNALGGARIAPVQAAAGALVRLPQPVKTNAAFGGWYLDEACTSAAPLDENGLYLMPGGDTTLFALWTQTGDALPFTYEEQDGGVTITGYTGTSASIVIPDRINGLPVNAIAARAFLGNAFITSVTLPETLVSIGDNAFARMSALRAIVIPDSVRTIGYAAFRGCEQLAQAHIGAGLERLGEQAFYGAKALTAFTASENGLFTAENGILYQGSVLVCVPAGWTGELILPETIHSIAPYAMAGSGVTSVAFPDSLWDMGEGALYDCDRLEAITLGDSGSELAIPARFASDADILRTVSLGSRVYAVGREAFLYCPALTDAFIAPEVSFIDENAFALAANGFAITGARGSAAHDCAAQTGALFRAMDGSDVTALAFDAESSTFVLGEQVTLSVTALPAMPEGEVLRWTTSDEAVVTVTDGVIRCVGRGTAVIHVAALNGVSASMEITVRGVPAQTVALEADTLFVPLGGKATFEPILTPAWADTACEWTIDNETIATVAENGTVTGLTIGETTLRVRTASGLETSAVLSVCIPTEEILLPESERALTLNAIDSPTVQLHATILPEDATFPAITYLSGDTSIATVSESGLITVKGAGETTVTLTNDHTADGTISLVIPVTVEPYDLSTVPAPQIPDKVYNGTSTPPDFTYTVGGRNLVKNTDYTITSDGSSSLGAHTVTITGKGLFTGSITAEYQTVEKQVTITYTGDTALEEFSWYDMMMNVSANVDRYSVQQDFALASDPTNWLANTPTKPGEYVMRLYVNDSYGVKGCELLINMRLVTSLIKSMSFAADEVHVLSGQSFYVMLDYVLEEGSSLSYPSITYTVDGPSGLLTADWMMTSNGRTYRGIDTTSGMEGVATVTATCSYASEPATLTVYVHADAKSFTLAKIKEVQEEAFLGTRANIINLGKEKLAIGSRAFADSDDLWQIVMPSTTVTLSADMVDGSDTAVLLFPSTSAQGLPAAIEMGLPFIIKK